MHFVLGIDGDLRVRTSRVGAWRPAAGVLTAPDVDHSIDALGVQVLLVFLDPESSVAATLLSHLTGAVRAISREECARLVQDADHFALMRSEGAEWARQAVEVLGGGVHLPLRLPVHPRVKKALRLLRSGAMEGGTSLEALADAVALSPGRLMHVFTQSIGIPIRPYLTWLKLQRAASKIVAGAPLSEAAHAAGFSDASHMTRTFRRMFGVPPSTIRPMSKAAS